MRFSMSFLNDFRASCEFFFFHLLFVVVSIGSSDIIIQL